MRKRFIKCRPRVIIAALSLALATTVGLGLPVAGSAVAATPAAAAANPCAGRSATYIVKKFYRGPAVYPLRCGAKTWGYNHLVAKHSYDPSSISLTVARGTKSLVAQVFTYSTDTCPSFTYIVVFNTGALNGNGVQPEGIITAYQQGASAQAC